MLHASNEIWTVAVTALLFVFWIIRRGIYLKRFHTEKGLDHERFNPSCKDHDIQHRALMFLMNQKTDSVLEALARTIAQERQKLGGVVRKPSTTQDIDALRAAAAPISTDRQSAYDQVLPMAHEGIAVTNIARQLKLPESEVSMVMRLNAS
jgi:hypothetical protein